MEKEVIDAHKLLASIPESVSATISKDKVRQVTILKGVNLKATGFTHKFAPPVSLLEASTWLVKQNGQQVFTLDITFLFTNNNGLIFLNGTYAEFDDFDDR